MSKSYSLLAAACLLFPALQAATFTRSALLTEDPRGRCAALVASPPTSATQILPTQDRFYLWFVLQDVRAGDMVSVQFLTPEGAEYPQAGTTFTPFTSNASTACYTEEVPVVGTLFSTRSGLWRARVTINGTLLTTIDVPVGTSAGGGGGSGGSSGNTLTVSAKANIFYSGREIGAPSGQAPPTYRLPAGAGRVLTFSSVTGLTHCCSGTPNAPPDGSESGGTDVTSLNGISGLTHVGRQLFLVGVFLTDNAPSPPGPARLNYTTTTAHFSEARPLIAQSFYIGDGLVDHGTGPQQSFYVPDEATRLYLGFVDGYAFLGAPGAYEDNTGQLVATFAVGSGAGGGGGATGGTNLIQNPGGDVNPPAGDCTTTIGGWTTTGNTRLCRYGVDMALTDPGPPDRGTHFFAGGPSDAVSFARQTVSLAAYASTIDSATQPYTLSGWLGGWDGQDDNAKLTVVFRNSAGGETGRQTIGPVLTAARNNATGLLLRSASGTVPASTRSAEIVLEITRTAGSNNDGFADSLSLQLVAGSGGGGGGGTGTTSLDLNPRALDFGRVTVGQTRDLLTVLRNNGSVAASLTAVPISNARFTLVSPQLPLAIGPGMSQTLTVRFSPTAAGDQTGTLTALNATATLTGVGEASGGGGGSTGCTFFVNPLTSDTGGTGGTVLILVTTAPGCAWTATTTTPWIEITAGMTGSGSGAVSLRMGANPSTAVRTGTVSIGNTTVRVTHTATQAGAPPCTVTLGSTTANVAGAGGSVTVPVTLSAGCASTVAAQSGVSWITATVSGTTVTLTVAANTAAQPRTGTVTIAGLTFTVNQAAASATTGPVISNGGVMNAASFTPASLPGGAIARGSFFSIFGLGIGPATPAQATAYPLTATLGETQVVITQPGQRVEAYPIYVAAQQINAIMPSNAPTGDVQVQVIYRGAASPAMTIRVVDTNFGIFSTAAGRGPGIVQNYVSATQTPLNTRTLAAKPGQYLILWGTGLGPITQPDYASPPAGDLPVPVEVTVGGKVARKTYSGRAPGLAGVDQIVMELPADAPVGCNVPVQVKAASGYSNIVTMAISRDGQACSDSGNPFERALAGTRGVAIFLNRMSLYVTETGKPPAEGTIDFGTAMFQQTDPAGEIGFNLLTSLPPLGTCTAFTGALDDGGLLGSGTALIPGKELDAGQDLRITSPSGVMKILPHSDEETNTGPYSAMLGGGMPGSSKPPEPLFLNGGTFRISSSGGRDVGAFTVNATMPSVPFQWTNRAALSTIARDQGFRLDWTGGTGHNVLVVGLANDSKTKASGGFFCFVPAAPGSFTVPASVLGNMPTVSEGAGLILGTLPSDLPPQFTAPGLDGGRVFFTQLYLRSLGVR